MKIKVILWLSVSLLLTSVFYFLIGDQKPIQKIIYDNHMSQSFNLIKSVVVPVLKDNQNYLYNNLEKNQFTIDEESLIKLRFTALPRLFNNNLLTNQSLPIFVTAIKKGELNLLKRLIKSVQDFYSQAFLLIFDLQLDIDESNQITAICNSTFLCTLEKFNFKKFPSHINDLKLNAFRPIIIQQVLNHAGSVLWLDVHNLLIPSAFSKITNLMKQATKDGIVCWTINQPTSAMTHPKMFTYFHTSPDSYYFHRMIDSSSFILLNTERIHKELMLPWIQCTLTPDCISPIGAQSSGCRFDKKPLYRYSGCHHYDVSALNILLGLMFNYNSDSYSAPDLDKFFKRITEQDLALGYAQNYSLVGNQIVNSTLIQKMKPAKD